MGGERGTDPAGLCLKRLVRESPDMAILSAPDPGRWGAGGGRGGVLCH